MKEEKKGCRLKFCGLSRFCDILAANRIRPDYVGFVFAPGRRQITADRARQLKAMLDPAIQTVGVFVNEDPETILALTPVLDLIQLHGDEDEDYIRHVKRQTGRPVIKALRLGGEGHGREAVLKAQELPCDYLLLDTFSKGQYGGSGRTFDWSLIPALSKPWFLAGGISLENMSRGMALGPWCLDVSSGVETEGLKDEEKMRAFAEAFRQENRNIFHI